jgi:hypothetical protein
MVSVCCKGNAAWTHLLIVDADSAAPYNCALRSSQRQKPGMAKNTSRIRDGVAQSESSTYLTRQPTSDSITSRQLPTPIDLSKALELIRFVGCETHHQVRAALRMLVPFIETEQAARLNDTDNTHDFPDDERSTLSSSFSHIEQALCSVVEMYVEKKLASRTKKAKDSNKGRLEVERKLEMVEKEVGTIVLETHRRSTENAYL